MGVEENLREGAQNLIDGETVIDVAVFQPKGTQVMLTAGVSLGGLAGGAMSSGSSGSALGAAWGVVAAQQLNKYMNELPNSVCVAGTDQHVYLIGMKRKTSASDIWPIARIEREKLGLNINKKFTKTEVTIMDEDSDAVFELEMPKLEFYDGKALINLLAS